MLQHKFNPAQVIYDSIKPVVCGVVYSICSNLYTMLSNKTIPHSGMLKHIFVSKYIDNWNKNWIFKVRNYLFHKANTEYFLMKKMKKDKLLGKHIVDI